MPVDNADHGLNPRLARSLFSRVCSWYLDAPLPRQLLLTTHNPLVLDGLPLQDSRVRLFTVSRTNTGKTSVRRIELDDAILARAQTGGRFRGFGSWGTLEACPMSEPLRIAMVVEGPTDFIVLDAVISSLLPDQDIEFQAIQPEYSAAFQVQPGPTGLGWSGVYRWCRQATDEGQGGVSGSSLFAFHQILVVQVDADVAGMTYQNGWIDDQTGDLPCEQPCPPPEATTNVLRKVMLRWLGEAQVPVALRTLHAVEKHRDLGDGRVVSDEQGSRQGQLGVSCEPGVAVCNATNSEQDPERTPTIIIRNRQAIISAWAKVRNRLVEARRFSIELLRQVELPAESIGRPRCRPCSLVSRRSQLGKHKAATDSPLR